MRQVHTAWRAVRPRALRMVNVEVIAPDAAQDGRHPPFNLVTLSLGNRRHALDDVTHARGWRIHFARFSKTGTGAVHKDGLHAEHVVHHVAVRAGSRATGAVAGHATERGVGRRTD